MLNTKLLVVDDDPKIRALLRDCFEGEGFEVHEAADEADTYGALAAQTFDLITLDLHLGPDDGFQIARKIRETSNTPIVMVTGKDDVIDRVVGLEIGADDYITKPFHLREVLARVRSVLRRARLHERDRPENADDAISYHFDNMIAVPDALSLRDRDGLDCTLTSGDHRLLRTFLERPKRVLSRDQLMDLMGGTQWSPMDRTIDNQVARLRKKIERDPANPSLIKTVRGIGYTLACDVRRSESGASRGV